MPAGAALVRTPNAASSARPTPLWLEPGRCCFRLPHFNCGCKGERFARFTAAVPSHSTFFTALGPWGRIEEGFQYLRKMVGAGHPTKWAGRSGSGRPGDVEEASCRVDGHCREVPGTRRNIAVDTVVAGFT